MKNINRLLITATIISASFLCAMQKEKGGLLSYGRLLKEFDLRQDPTALNELISQFLVGLEDEDEKANIEEVIQSIPLFDRPDVLKHAQRFVEGVSVGTYRAWIISEIAKINNNRRPNLLDRASFFIAQLDIIDGYQRADVIAALSSLSSADEQGFHDLVWTVMERCHPFKSESAYIIRTLSTLFQQQDHDDLTWIWDFVQSIEDGVRLADTILLLHLIPAEHRNQDLCLFLIEIFKEKERDKRSELNDLLQKFKAQERAELIRSVRLFIPTNETSAGCLIILCITKNLLEFSPQERTLMCEMLYPYKDANLSWVWIESILGSLRFTPPAMRQQLITHVTNLAQVDSETFEQLELENAEFVYEGKIPLAFLQHAFEDNRFFQEQVKAEWSKTLQNSSLDSYQLAYFIYKNAEELGVSKDMKHSAHQVITFMKK